MSTDGFDSYPYQVDEQPADEAARRHYWAVAIGLQAVDGLQASPYAHEVADGYVSGDYTLAQTGELLRTYHAQPAHDSTREADLVAQRIAEVLAARSFACTPDMLFLVHRTLFQDLDATRYCPGRAKTERLVKQEPILNGDSVLYADPSMVQISLDFLFREELRQPSLARLDEESLVQFCAFIANLWQVHPFVEGNTRTTAVFAELYLGQLGYLGQADQREQAGRLAAGTANEPFEQHALYFRNALVRAVYRNPKAGVLPEPMYLQRFFAHLLLGQEELLDNEELVCLPLFEDPSLLRNIDPAKALHRT